MQASLSRRLFGLYLALFLLAAVMVWQGRPTSSIVPVLVLDEATSALDVETEQAVMAAVNSLHGDKTLVIVAHRLSTVAGCDLLYRLEEGHVTRSGTFAEVTAS